MPHSRFFLDGSLELNQEVVLLGDESHHLQRVMRKSVYERVELVNGQNVLGVAEILEFEKRGTRLRILDVEHRPAPSFSIIICQALPRMNHLETIVEKGCELGMTQLWLFPGDLSEKKSLSPSAMGRLEAITISALKQCGRLDLPKITLMKPLSQWSEQSMPIYFGDTAKSAPPFLSVLGKKEGVLFCVGPESGFSREEVKHLQRLNAIGVSLHPNILRTETASLVALSLISYL